MTKRITFFMLAAAILCCFTASADPIKIKGVYNNNRYDDHADHLYSTYVGWNANLQKAIFVVENGIYAMTVDGNNATLDIELAENYAYDINYTYPWNRKFEIEVLV